MKHKLISTIVRLLLIAAACFAFPARSHAQGSGYDDIQNWGCIPVECQNNDGPAFQVYAQTKISAFCNNLNKISTGIIITTLIPCKSLVIAETSADVSHQQLLDDCGNPYYLGQVNAYGTVLNAYTNAIVYKASVFEDCIDGTSADPPPFSGC